MAIPASRIGLPTSGAQVLSAGLVAADAWRNDKGEYCKLKGVIRPADPAAPNTEFQINLPSQWNKRALQMGGGGNNGVLITGLDSYKGQSVALPHPVAEGYATLGSDGGHQGAHMFDFNYALNEESLRNYVDYSIKKVHDAAVVIMHAYYGEAPQRFYFAGNSKGGHEALMAAVRYSDDYDGVIAIAPAYNMVRLFLDFLHFGQVLYANGHEAWINNAQRKLLVNAVYAACDSLDNLRDGIISHISACNKVFNIDTVKAILRCEEGGGRGKACFTDAQIRFLEQKSSATDLGFSVAGQRNIPGWPLLEGSDLLLKGWLPAFGYTPSIFPYHAPLYLVGSGYIRYFIARDPELDPMSFNPADYHDQIQAMAKISDLTEASLEPFRAKGGKVLLIHGALDSNISQHNSVEYYRRQVHTMGQELVDSFLRFYVIPGYDHGFGRYNLGFDGLGVLVDWVESGRAPGVIESIDNNAKDPTLARERPMCPWPAYPRFTGKPGSEHSLESFSCVLPE